MDEYCKQCALPKELCVCGDLAKTTQKITIRTDKRKWGKVWTIVSGLDSDDINLKKLAKKLKRKLACAGTIKNEVIELSGNHVEKIKQVLVKEGFQAENIEIK